MNDIGGFFIALILVLVANYIGSISMLIYAIQEAIVPVIVTNAIILVLLTISSMFFIIFRRTHSHVPDTDTQTRDVKPTPQTAES